jgi:DNA polymerase-3 subunit delta
MIRSTDASELLRTGKGGLFFLFGDDEFRKEEAARAIAEAHLDPATADFNRDILRGSEVSVETLASIVATPPLMATWRVVVLKEVEALASQWNARELLLGLARRPPRDLAMILLADIGKSRARFYQDLKKAARSLEIRAMDLDDVPGWAMARGREAFQVEVDEAAARALAAAVGTDLGILWQELAKLAEFVGEGGTIRVEEVEAAGTSIPKQDRWEWFDLVGARRWNEALRGLRVLLLQGESGVALMIGLGTHLLRLGVVVEGGTTALEALLPPNQKWLSKRLSWQARKWTGEELEHALLGLRRVDQLLKSSTLSAEHLMQEWLLGEMARQMEVA